MILPKIILELMLWLSSLDIYAGILSDHYL